MFAPVEPPANIPSSKANFFVQPNAFLSLQRIRKALAHKKVEEKRMFGGIAFMVNGKMCVTVNNRPDHVMMVRIIRRPRPRRRSLSNSPVH